MKTTDRLAELPFSPMIFAFIAFGVYQGKLFQHVRNRQRWCARNGATRRWQTVCYHLVIIYCYYNDNLKRHPTDAELQLIFPKRMIRHKRDCLVIWGIMNPDYTFCMPDRIYALYYIAIENALSHYQYLSEIIND